MREKNRLGVVLIVEDEWLLRDDIASELKDGGWEVLEASTGEGAVGLLKDTQHRRPDH